MDTISGMFRPAFDRIRPSIASAAELSSFHFNRLVSLTGSFNSRTSLLAGDGEEILLSQSQVHETTPVQTTASTTSTRGAFDIEAPATTPDQVTGDDGGASQEGETAAAEDDDDDETKRVSKNVHPVCLSVATGSLAMSVNLPAKTSGALYVANLGFICLGLFTSLGLSMYTIVSRPGDAAVASVQKQGMLLAMASVLASFTLRICATLPGETLEVAWLIFFLLTGAASLYLTLAWKLAGGGGRAQQRSTVNEEAADDRV